MAKTNIQEKDTKVKSSTKKTKKVETLEYKDETLDDVKVVEDSVQVDVEIDLRSYNHSDVVNGYIRHKRSIWYDWI